jgi:hypothetical protein
MNDKELIKNDFARCNEYSTFLGGEILSLMQKARQDEKEKILNFIGKLKINDEFRQSWYNEVMSTGEDVLKNTLDMVIREIKEMR